MTGGQNVAGEHRSEGRGISERTPCQSSSVGNRLPLCDPGPQSRAEQVGVNPSLREMSTHRWHIHFLPLPFGDKEGWYQQIWAPPSPRGDCLEPQQMTHLRARLLLPPFNDQGVWLYELIIPPLVPVSPSPFLLTPCVRSGFHLPD